MKPAPRVADMTPSPIRMVTDGAPPGAVPLGLGEPTWPMPEAARGVLASFEGACSYGPQAGLPELRETVAAFYGADVDEVMITAGSQGALFDLLVGWVGPGDRVLVPDPGFVAYPALARIAEAGVARYPLDAADRFRLDVEALIERLDTPGLKAVVINAPSNPTGGGVDPEALQRLSEACAARDLLLISDEVYRDLHFGPRPPSVRDVGGHGVVVSSVSKAWGSPGLRVGWIVGQRRWLPPARVVHGYAVTAAARPAQLAARALIEASDEVLPAARSEIEGRWRALAAALRRHLDLDPTPPDGTFYWWMELPESARDDPMAFCLRLRDDAGVVIIPGIVFGEHGRRHARLSFAASPAQIEEGIRRLAPYWSDA